MKINELIKKLQKQPEDTKKIILWSVVVIISLGFLFLWFRDLRIKLKTFQKENFYERIGMPELKEELNSAPKIELPEIKTPELSEEELKELEKAAGEIQVEMQEK